MDEAEPELDPLDYENVRYYLGNGLEVSNLYPYYFAKTIYEGQVDAGQKEIINLIRSGWIGNQTIEYKVSIENIPVFTRNDSNFKLK